MCLDIKQHINEDIQSRLDKDGMIECWKCYYIHRDGYFCSPYQSHRVGKSGDIVAHQTPKILFEKVNAGIHVILTENEINDMVLYMKRTASASNMDVVAVKVTAKREHFVGAGVFEGGPRSLTSAVFSQVNLSSDEFMKHIKNGKEFIKVDKIYKLNSCGVFHGGEVCVVSIEEQSVIFRFDDRNWTCGIAAFNELIWR